MFDPYILSFFRCLGKARLRDCGISWVSSLIFFRCWPLQFIQQLAYINEKPASNRHMYLECKHSKPGLRTPGRDAQTVCMQLPWFLRFRRGKSRVFESILKLLNNIHNVQQVSEKRKDELLSKFISEHKMILAHFAYIHNAL